jgi:sugar lactone lactonase YvrE
MQRSSIGYSSISRFSTTLFHGLIAFAFLLIAPAAYAQVQPPANGYINTIAGSLNNPGGVAVDRRNGTIYFTDGSSPNRVVKKIDPTTGIVSTYAGGGWYANSPRQIQEPNGTWVECGPLIVGYGGPATSAMLGAPTALAVDQSGNLYIADEDDNRVFEVTTDGIIHGLVGNGCPLNTGDGGLAANATVAMPIGVAVDAAGNVFISSYLENYIRKIDTSGNITQYAGGRYGPYSNPPVTPGDCGEGSDAILAQFSSPMGLAVDSNGILYIADSSNGRIRKVVPGTPNSQICFHPLPGYTPSGYVIEDVTGSLNTPTSVALDTKGNLYINDSGNNRILEMLQSNSQYTYIVAGNGSPGFSGDGGPATSAALGGTTFLEVSNIDLDVNNNLYIADTTNGRMRMVSPSTIMSASCSPNPIVFGSDSTCTATLTGSSPTGSVTWSIDGSVWQTRQLNGSNSQINGFTAQSVGMHTITAAYSGDSNNLSGVASTVLTIKATQTITFTAPTSPVAYGVPPITLSATATSGLPITFSIISGPGTINGNTLTVIGPGTIVVAANQAGNVSYMPATQVTRTVVANYALPAHGIITTIAGNGTAGYTGDGGLGANAELNSPWGVTVDRSGNVYIADANNVAIRAISYTNGYIYTEAGSGLGGDGVAADPYGDFYIANTGYNRILIGEPSGSTINYYLVAGSGSGTAGFVGDGGAGSNALLRAPQDVFYYSSSPAYLYVADTGNNRIRKVNLSSVVITEVAGNGTASYSGDNGAATSAGLNAPYGMAVDGSGNVYIADTYNNRIRKVTSTGTISTIAGNGTYGFSGDGGAATAAELYMPTGVAVDSAGNVYIADFGNNRVRMVNTAGNISTVAGNGTAGFSGDGYAATSAELYRPSGVALDASGNLYIADANNNRIRVVGH